MRFKSCGLHLVHHNGVPPASTRFRIVGFWWAFLHPALVTGYHRCDGFRRKPTPPTCADFSVSGWGRSSSAPPAPVRVHYSNARTPCQSECPCPYGPPSGQFGPPADMPQPVITTFDQERSVFVLGLVCGLGFQRHPFDALVSGIILDGDSGDTLAVTSPKAANCVLATVENFGVSVYVNLTLNQFDGSALRWISYRNTVAITVATVKFDSKMSYKSLEIIVPTWRNWQTR